MMVGVMMVVVVVMAVLVTVVVVVVVTVVVVVKERPSHFSCGQLLISLPLKVWKEWEWDSLPQKGCHPTDLIALAVKWTFVEL
jgi:hypothetical protein